MATLSPQQIYQYALQAGFSPSDAVNATAIALAESGGNTSVVNGIGAMGLWQIYDGSYPSASRIEQMSDPLANAKAAFAKFQASSQTTCGGWWPWASYDEGPCTNSDPNRNNSWRSFLGQVQGVLGVGGATDTGASSQPVATVDPTLASAATLVSSQSAGSSSAPSFLGSSALGVIFARLASPGFWWSVGFFVLAGLLIVVGLLIYFHKQVEQAIGEVGKAAEVAAV